MDFMEILAVAEDGAALDEIQRALSEVVKAVGGTSRDGSVTVKVHVGMGKGGPGARKVSVVVNAAVPRKEISGAVLFADDDGVLSLENPNHTMFEEAMPTGIAAPKRRGRPPRATAPVILPSAADAVETEAQGLRS